MQNRQDWGGIEPPRKEIDMRTFIFIKNIKSGNKLERVIVGMTQSSTYPSSMTRLEDSEFYRCDCVEVTEHCHIKLGVVANLPWYGSNKKEVVE